MENEQKQKEYVEPTIEVVVINNENIIVTSVSSQDTMDGNNFNLGDIEGFH